MTELFDRGLPARPLGGPLGAAKNKQHTNDWPLRYILVNLERAAGLRIDLKNVPCRLQFEKM